MSFKIELHRELTQLTTLQDSALGIMRWGTLNAFPQTLENLIEQSPSAKPAVERAATFYAGGKFEGDDTIINSYGMTLGRLVEVVAKDRAIYKAFAIHCNYNLKGEVSSIIPFRIADLRFNEFDELGFASKIGYHNNFGSNSVVKKTIVTTPTKSSIRWIDVFNPEYVETQINKTKGGISNYQGQMLYSCSSGNSAYPIPPLQAQINFVLADIENSILMRKESTTGFINSYILKSTLPAESPILTSLQEAMEEAQGARGTGKIIMLTDLSPEELNATVLEEIGAGSGTSGTIVESIDKAYSLCQKSINKAYLIPPILAGNNENTGFSEPDLRDAYFVFNSVTQKDRDVIQNEINRILKHSVFPIKEIQLQKLTLEEDKEGKENV